MTDVGTAPRPTVGARGGAVLRRLLRGALAALAIGSGSCVSDQANPVAARPVPMRAVASAVSCTLARGTSATAQCATVATADGATPSEALARVQQRRKAPDARAMQLTIGGQGQYVDLQPTAVSYNAGSQKFVMSLRVRNLFQQPLGTSDLVSGAPTGVSVILETDPAIAPGGGTGVVAFDNPDSTITVTRAGQPIVTYREVVQANGATSARDWQFSMPLTVTSVKFDAFVYSTIRDSTASGFVRNAEWLAMANGPGIHRCGLKANGQVYCWQGSTQLAGLGQLGNGRVTYTSAMQPATVQPGFATSNGSLAVGAGHACAIATTGALYCWGSNKYGQLGTGTVAFDGRVEATPQLVQSVGTQFTQVAVNGLSSTSDGATCAISTTSEVWCWGAAGRRGDGSNERRASPVNTGLQASSIDGAEETFCAVDLAGEIRCWGRGPNGQMGDSTTTSFALTRATARRPPGVTGWSKVSVGPRHVCGVALPASARVYCWGYNNNATNPVLALDHADSVLSRVLVPRPVKPFATSAAAVHAGADVTCGRDIAAVWYCWGNNTNGQFGNGTSGWTSSVIPLGYAATSIVPAKGGAYSCGEVASLPSALACWGLNTNGAAGTSSPVGGGVATPQEAWGDGIALVAGGLETTCAIQSGTLTLRCMGQASGGLVPDGVDRTETSTVPRGILGLDLVEQVVTTSLNTCALRFAGTDLWCWGRGTNGENGDGTLFNRNLPVHVAIPGGLAISAISGGVRHLCVVAGPTREMYCWGGNASGQAGQPSSTPAVTMPSLVAPGTAFFAVAASNVETCALRADSTAYCWTGSAPTFTARTMPPGIKFKSISAGLGHFCAIGTDQRAYCWGQNGRGQLGDGTTTPHSEPEVVYYGSSIYVSLAAYGNSTCGINGAGQFIECWGENTNGAAGLGPDVPFAVFPTSNSGWVVAAPMFGASQQGACVRSNSLETMFCWGIDVGNGGPVGTPTYYPGIVTPP